MAGKEFVVPDKIGVQCGQVRMGTSLGHRLYTVFDLSPKFVI